MGDDKPPLFLVPPALLLHASLAHRDGAIKYGPYNWRHKRVKMSVYLSAILRHVLCLIDGEDVAHDSRHSHEGHIAACCAIILDARETGNLIDDRPAVGKASVIIERMNNERKATMLRLQTIKAHGRNLIKR